MKEGKITKVLADRKFFFVDTEYWCHFNQYNDDNPEVGDEVEYEPEIRSDGKKNALKARLIIKKFVNDDIPASSNNQLMESYFKTLQNGYFKEKDYLIEELITEFPMKLAKYFTKDSGKNKPSQIRKFFDQTKLIESKLKIKKDFNNSKVELLQIIPLANNAKGRNHISQEFFDFLKINIDESIKSETNLIKGFIPHFQALIGYYKTN